MVKERRQRAEQRCQGRRRGLLRRRALAETQNCRFRPVNERVVGRVNEHRTGLAPVSNRGPFPRETVLKRERRRASPTISSESSDEIVEPSTGRAPAASQKDTLPRGFSSRISPVAWPLLRQLSDVPTALVHQGRGIQGRSLMVQTVRPVVALLESRMRGELARLIEKHGGRPLCVPALREVPELSPQAATNLVNDLQRDRQKVVIFMTGVAVSLLFETADQLGRRPDLVAALKSVTTVARGPKPTAALRGFGVPPTLTAREPFTAAEVLDAMSGIELADRPIILFHYGERSETLAETLLACRADLEEFWLYRWMMPEDTDGLERLVHGLIAGQVDAMAITCQIQFRHLYRIAERLRVTRQLIRRLNDHVVVGAVGPKCAAILQSHGVHTPVVPDHPKMGPLAITLMRHMQQRVHQDSSSPEHASVTH